MITNRKTGKFSPLDREPAYMKVYRAIEQNIAEGVLADGEALPIEAELCEQFQVTRSTVREGLRLLQQSGLIARGARKKLLVRKPDSTDVALAASRSLALGGVTFNEVWDALSNYYPLAVRLATERLTTSRIDELAGVRATMAAAPESDEATTVACAEEFFHGIARGLDNKVMLAMLVSLNMMIGESLRLVIGRAPNARSRILTAQGHIIDGFRRRDGVFASQWMSRHIADLKRGYLVADVDMDQPIL